MFKKSIYNITSDSYFNIHILLNNYCNNRCVYCGQYEKYGDKEIDIEKFKKIIFFFKNGLGNKKYNFVLEGGEPSFYSKLSELFLFLFNNNILNKIIFLSNGRIPRKNFNLFKYYLNNNVLNSIVIHVPLGKEPFYNEWMKDIITFLTFLRNNGINKKITLVGIIYNKVSSYFLPTLLKIGEKYNDLIFNIEPGLAHPSIEKRHYLNYSERLDIMKNLVNFFNIADKKKLKIGLGGFMLCLLDSIKNKSNEKILNNLYKGKLDMSKNIEIHILLDGNGIIALPISNSQDTYININSIFDFECFEDYKIYLNGILEKLYIKNYNKIPSYCKDDCIHYGKGCNGDHFKLISDYLKNSSNEK